MNILKRISLATLILLSLFFASCDVNTPTRPASKGSPSEIIVVVEDHLWNTSVSDTIKAFFASDRPGLPQPEQLFKVIQIDLEEFGRLFETHRNILTLALDSSLNEPKYETGYDVWASPQRVVKISAPTIELLKSSFKEHSDEIFNLFENAEIKRIQKLFSKSLNVNASTAIKSKFNLDMDIPSDYYLAKNEDNLIWLRRETTDISQGLMIYSYPYTDTLAYNPQKIISVRNQFTSVYIPGPSENSYMVVADDFIKPQSRIITIKKELAIETRGLWEVENDFMGGPFINYTFVDRKNNMVIALDGYVYAPNKDKANLMRQVQAILLSFELVEK